MKWRNDGACERSEPSSNMLNKKGGDYHESLEEYKQQRKDAWRALNKKRPAGSWYK